MIRIGAAGWSIPRQVASRFPEAGSSLERYAARFSCAEINSTFYRTHRPQTFERWAAATPGGFRFAVKLSRAITHERRLVGCDDLLAAFLDQVAPLGQKLGPLLIQSPPSLAFDAAVVEGFLALLRRRYGGPAAWEPRHASWFDPEPERRLRDHAVACVAADPAKSPAAGRPGGYKGLQYWRLHGSPRMYFSSYGAEELARLAADLLRSEATERWCIFDNTASGAAAADALALQSQLS